MKKLVLFLFLIPCFARGELVQQLYRNRDYEGLKSLWIAQSKSGREVQQKNSMLDQLQRLDVRCRAQLDTGLLPKDCFALVSVEVEIGLIGKDKSKSSLQGLNAICRKRVENMEARDLETIDSSIDPGGFEDCRRRIQSRIADLMYARALIDPTWSFSRRLNE
jgi:hypothetical protein